MTEGWPDLVHEFVVDSIHTLMMLSGIETTAVKRYADPI